MAAKGTCPCGGQGALYGGRCLTCLGRSSGNFRSAAKRPCARPFYAAALGDREITSPGKRYRCLGCGHHIGCMEEDDVRDHAVGCVAAQEGAQWRRAHPHPRPARSAAHHGNAFGQRPAETSVEFEQALASFVSAAQRMIDEEDDRFFADARKRTGDATFGYHRLVLERGPRYVRVVREDRDPSTGRSAWAFIDTTTGDILKADSYKKPAKGVRGNVFDADPLKAVTQYGARYLRRR
jgi:hypothetical protein